jgi:hypothetical protein
MDKDSKLLSPCGLYCGVCGIMIAYRDDNLDLRKHFSRLWDVPTEEIVCEGCLSDNLFFHCRQCEIRSCTQEKEIEGCHLCIDFPCGKIESFPFPKAKERIFKAIERWKKVGTEDFIRTEEERHKCPECKTPLFRRATSCIECGREVDLN